MADALLQTRHSNPEGILSVNAKDMVDRWNHDMSTFIALLYEICRRNYESKISQNNKIMVRFVGDKNSLAK